MLSLCIKTIHSLLTLPHSHHHHYRCRNISPGLGFLAGEHPGEPAAANVLLSVSIKKDCNSCGEADGIMSSSAGSVMEAMSCCTESLGFESSDQLEEEVTGVCEDGEEESRSRSRSRARENLRCRRKMAENISDTRTEEAKKKIFPKPLSWLNRNGHPGFYLKSGRSNGRLEIKEIRIDHPELLRTSRQNGRLTLRLIKPEPEPVQEQPKPVLEPISLQEPVCKSTDTSVVEMVGRADKLIKPNEESNQRQKFEISRRCYDVSYHHHQHREVRLWSNRCVMSG